MPTITLQQLEALAYDRVDQNTALFPKAEVDAIINEAIRVLNLFTGFLQATVDVPGYSVAGQRLYPCPAPILFPLKVQFEARQLDMVPLKRLGEDYRSWATDTTSGFGPVARWSPVGITQFVIHPIDARGGQYMNVTGVIEPPALVNLTDTMSLEDEYVEIIEEYCAHRLPLKQPGKLFDDASVLYQEFLRKMKDRKRWQRMKMPRYWVQAKSPS